MLKNENALMKSTLTIKNGWIEAVNQCFSPHFDKREKCESSQISLLVIHNISLPAGQFGTDYISDLFMGRLNPQAHSSFEDIYQLKVSAHCLIRRDGEIIQYVSFDARAWHAGVSSFKGKTKCNDFSIGIELEGTDTTPYTEEQYQQLTVLTKALQTQYPEIKNNIVGHSDIAPGRKTDPGESFKWEKYQGLLKAK